MLKGYSREMTSSTYFYCCCAPISTSSGEKWVSHYDSGLQAGDSAAAWRPKFCDGGLRVCNSGVSTTTSITIGSVFGRADFFREILFLGRRIFLRILQQDLFFLIFVGASAQKNPPGKSSKITTKFPDTFLQRGRSNK